MSITPASAAEAPAVPAVHSAFVAIEMDLTKAVPQVLKTPTVFVLLGDSVHVGPGRAPRIFLVARDAGFGVLDDGRLDRPRAFTALMGGAPCVGSAERKVLLGVMDDAGVVAEYERGLILEGCPPPSGRYGMTVIEGTHPTAKQTMPSSAPFAPGGAPAWIGALGSGVTVHRFAASGELFVVMRPRPTADGGASAEMHVGSGETQIGMLDVPATTTEPSLVDLDGQRLVVARDLVVRIAPDRLVRMQERSGR